MRWSLIDMSSARSARVRLLRAGMSLAVAVSGVAMAQPPMPVGAFTGPTVTGINGDATGSQVIKTCGGQHITINGDHYNDQTGSNVDAVEFEVGGAVTPPAEPPSVPAASFTITDNNNIDAVTPALPDTTAVNIRVRRQTIWSAVSSADVITYARNKSLIGSLNPTGAVQGASPTLVITGSCFNDGATSGRVTQVIFRGPTDSSGPSAAIAATLLPGASGTTFTQDSDTQITVHAVPGTLPAGTTAGHGIGTYTVDVVTKEGSTADMHSDTAAPPAPLTPPNPDTFTVTSNAPTVTSVAPNKGPRGGNASVPGAIVITGSGFLTETGVMFGHSPASVVHVDSDTQMHVNDNGENAADSSTASNTVDVTVTNTSGCPASCATSATNSGDKYTYLPTVSTVSPNAGPTTGLVPDPPGIDISGAGFVKPGGTCQIIQVSFGVGGGQSPVNADLSPSNVISCNDMDLVLHKAPVHSAFQNLDVQVEISPDSVSPIVSGDHFTYTPGGGGSSPPSVVSVAPMRGPAAGGTMVTINGASFTSDGHTCAITAINFGGTAGGSPACNGDGQATVTSPAHAGGPVDVTVVTPGGTSTTSSADVFTFVEQPTVTGLSPNNGPSTGGTSVTITGTAFLGRTGSCNIHSIKVGSVGTVSSGISCSDTSATFTTPPSSTAGPQDVQVTTDGGTSPINGNDVFTYNTLGPGGQFHPAGAPVRIADSRTVGNIGGFSALGAGQSAHVPVVGTFGGVTVPANATGVTLNVTILSAAGGPDTFITLWPTGQNRPLASNLNATQGTTVQNLVEVGIGNGGQVDIYNNLNTINFVIDLEGWVTPNITSSDGLLIGVTPNRVSDTRPGTLGPGQTEDVQVTGVGGVPVNAEAVVFNLTVQGGTAPVSFLTAWPTGSAQPLASNSNFVQGQTVANRVVVRVGNGGKVTIFNNLGNVAVIVDLNAYYTDPTSPASMVGGTTFVSPQRLFDTRNANAPLSGGQSQNFHVAGNNGVPANAKTLIINITAVSQAGSPESYLTVWPGPSSNPQPGISDVNFYGGETLPNLVVVRIDLDGSINVYNNLGVTNVVGDVYGYTT